MRRRKAQLPIELFLSHASRDRRFADKIAATLRSNGIPVWYSPTHIKGAQQWHDEIGRALERCDWFAIVLSPNAVRSTWVKRELLYALNNDRYRERIIPILHQDCEFSGLSWTLQILQWIDFRHGFELGRRELLRIWGIKT